MAHGYRGHKWKKSLASLTKRAIIHHYWQKISSNVRKRMLQSNEFVIFERFGGHLQFLRTIISPQACAWLRHWSIIKDLECVKPDFQRYVSVHS